MTNARALGGFLASLRNNPPPPVVSQPKRTTDDRNNAPTKTGGNGEKRCTPPPNPTIANVQLTNDVKTDDSETAQTANDVKQDAPVESKKKKQHPKAMAGLLQQIQMDKDKYFEKPSPKPSEVTIFTSATQPPKSNKKVLENFSCYVCNITCTSMEGLETHFNGKKHQKMLKKVELGQVGGMKQVVSLPCHSIVQCELDDLAAVEPIIGLEYVVEKRSGSLAEPTFICELCETINNPSAIVAHIVGQKHRMKYLKKHYFDEFCELTGYPDYQVVKSKEMSNLLREQAALIVNEKGGPGNIGQIRVVEANPQEGITSSLDKPFVNWGQVALQQGQITPSRPRAPRLQMKRGTGPRPFIPARNPQHVPVFQTPNARAVARPDVPSSLDVQRKEDQASDLLKKLADREKFLEEKEKLLREKEELMKEKEKFLMEKLQHEKQAALSSSNAARDSYRKEVTPTKTKHSHDDDKRTMDDYYASPSSQQETKYSYDYSTNRKATHYDEYPSSNFYPFEDGLEKQGLYDQVHEAREVPPKRQLDDSLEDRRRAGAFSEDLADQQHVYDYSHKHNESGTSTHSYGDGTVLAHSRNDYYGEEEPANQKHPHGGYSYKRNEHAARSETYAYPKDVSLANKKRLHPYKADVTETSKHHTDELQDASCDDADAYYKELQLENQKRLQKRTHRADEVPSKRYCDDKPSVSTSVSVDLYSEKTRDEKQKRLFEQVYNFGKIMMKSRHGESSATGSRDHMTPEQKELYRAYIESLRRRVKGDRDSTTIEQTHSRPGFSSEGALKHKFVVENRSQDRQKEEAKSRNGRDWSAQQDNYEVRDMDVETSASRKIFDLVKANTSAGTSYASDEARKRVEDKVLNALNQGSLAPLAKAFISSPALQKALKAWELKQTEKKHHEEDCKAEKPASSLSQLPKTKRYDPSQPMPMSSRESQSRERAYYEYQIASSSKDSAKRSYAKVAHHRSSNSEQR